MTLQKPLIDASLYHFIFAQTDRCKNGKRECFYVVPFISNFAISRPQTVGYNPKEFSFRGVDPILYIAIHPRDNAGIVKAKEVIEGMGVEPVVGKDEFGHTYVRGHFPILDFYKKAGADVLKCSKALSPFGIGLANIFAQFERKLGGDMLESTLSYRLKDHSDTLNQPGNYPGFTFSRSSCSVMRRAIDKINAGMN